MLMREKVVSAIPTLAIYGDVKGFSNYLRLALI